MCEPQRLRRARAGALTAPALAVLFGCAGTPNTGDVDSRTVTVEHVIDGDTIIVDQGERVRFLGIDAPEVAHDGQPGEPCGDEATNLIISTIRDQQVTLSADPGQPQTDKYGRTLAYVESEGTDLSATLLEAGLAELYQAADGIVRWEDYQNLADTSNAPNCGKRGSQA